MILKTGIISLLLYFISKIIYRDITYVNLLLCIATYLFYNFTYLLGIKYILDSIKIKSIV